MKRRELLARISKIAKAGGIEAEFVRAAGDHDIYRVGARKLVSRHREINELTAKGFLKTAAEGAQR